MTGLRSEVADLLSQAQLRYSTVWEDHALLEEGLQVGPGDDVLSICSSGDNALALLLQEPRSVTVVDLNPAQTALLELKLAAFRHADHPSLLALLGLAPGDGVPTEDAVSIYRSLRDRLSPEAAGFWDSHEHVLADGVARAGRLESYIHGFGRDHLDDVWPEGLLRRLVDAPTLTEQAALFEAEGRTPEFERRFAWYFGREMMAKHGRDPAQFVHVQDGDVGGYFLARVIWALTHTRLRDNFYLRWFLERAYGPPDRGPVYLRPSSFPRIRELADRVRLHTGELEQLLARSGSGAFSKGNFSDMFEYMSPDLATAVLTALHGAFREAGRLAWWSLLVPRPVPPALRPRLRPLEQLADDLWSRDRAWFYRSFHLAEVAA